ICFAGSLYVQFDKQNEIKAYVLTITCAVTRAVHFELVTALTTKAFFNAFRRFVSRRGLPKIIISDNALTFARASKDMEKLFNVIKDQEAIDHYSQNRINWKFNVLRAPW